MSSRSKKNIAWKIKVERFKLICLLDSFFNVCKAHGQHPNIEDIVGRENIDCLLLEAAIDVTTDSQQIIQFVIRSGYEDKPKIDEDGKPLSRRTTPLHHAARDRRNKVSEIIPSLFEIYDKFDVNYTDEFGLTHFHIACEHGCYYVVEKFLELGQVDSNLLVPETGDSPLHLAVSKGRKNVVELLLNNGANPNLNNADGMSPLHVVSKAPHYNDDLMKMLFELSDEKYHPVQVDALDKWGRTPLHVALFFQRTNLVQFLLRQGANPHRANSFGSTYLHIICEKFREDDLAEKFFEACDDIRQTIEVDARDKFGNTPLHLALKYGLKKEAELLLRRRADPNLDNAEGSTPLHIICKRDNDDGLAELFFKFNDDLNQLVQIDITDSFNRTPLYWAVASLSPNAVNTLLNHGADLSSFVFPSETDFDKYFGTFEVDDYEFKLNRSCRTMAVVESLENGGYELDRSDALTIMKLFDRQGFFQMSTDFDQRRGDSWYDDEEFSSEAKKIMISSSLSLYELIRLQPKEASKLFTCLDSLKSTSSINWGTFSERYSKVCASQLCEKLCRKFLRCWALECFSELTRCRLPFECNEIIIDQLMNKNLYNICLATKI